jgi:glycosyltransferase involved in cell wall biosynthesis
MMKVCMMAYTFYEADNRVRRYAEALVKRGDGVDAIALRREGQPRFEIIRGVRVYRIQERRIDETGPFSYLRKLMMFFVRSMWFLTLQDLKQRYDIIHVHSVPDFQVFATIVPKITGTRVILDIHDIVPEFYASKFKVNERSLIFRMLLLVEKLSIAYSDHVIISNHLWHAKLTQRSVRPEKCTALINYPDTSIFSGRQRATAASDDFLMCYPGTLNQHQGVDVAIRALALLRSRAPNVKFLIIGDGPDREKLKAIAKQERLDDSVTFQGFVPMETVAETMAAVDLGVVPKRKDSFGNEAFSTKIMEFMAMGVPVVASNTRIDKYYFNEQLVQFFESDNAEDLAAKILDLVRDSTKRDVLRTNARRFIDQNNWDVKKSEYLDLVDHLVAGAMLATTGTGADHPVTVK